MCQSRIAQCWSKVMFIGSDESYFRSQKGNITEHVAGSSDGVARLPRHLLLYWLLSWCVQPEDDFELRTERSHVMVWQLYQYVRVDRTSNNWDVVAKLRCCEGETANKARAEHVDLWPAVLPSPLSVIYCSNYTGPRPPSTWGVFTNKKSKL